MFFSKNLTFKLKEQTKQRQYFEGLTKISGTKFLGTDDKRKHMNVLHPTMHAIHSWLNN